jgi:hypothetical protein
MQAEKEQRQTNLIDGCKLAEDMIKNYNYFRTEGLTEEDTMIEYLDQTNRACKLLQHHTGYPVYRRILYWKAKIYFTLGQRTLMVTTLRQADALFGAAERIGRVKEAEYDLWRDVIAEEGFIHTVSHQLEPAKCCFQRILNWPCLLDPLSCMDGLFGMAQYHQARKEWVNVIQYSQRGLSLLSGFKEYGTSLIEPRLLLLLAAAAEAQGDMSRARGYDDKVMKA